MALKAAKRIARTVPQIIALLPEGEEFAIPESLRFSWIKKDGKLLLLRLDDKVASGEYYPAHFHITYDPDNQEIVVGNLYDKDYRSGNQIVIKIAVFGEVILEYDYQYVDELDIIARFLDLVLIRLTGKKIPDLKPEPFVSRGYASLWRKRRL